MFEKLKDKRLFEKIVDQIKEAIVSGALKVGDKLPPEHELARILGVSRTAVREALRILELSGLVIIKKGNQGGCFIQEVASNYKMVDYLSDHWRIGNITLTHLTDARFWLESIIIDIVGQKATKRELDLLRKSIDTAERLYKEGKEFEKIQENLDFHLLLAKMTDNTILIDTLSGIFELLKYMLVKIKPSRSITNETFRCHAKIVDFLETGDIEGAKEANKAHIKELSARLMKKYAKEKNLPQFNLKLQQFINFEGAQTLAGIEKKVK
jgi:GntR family transcriptional regulator, transcriptional repressor for pyruvate dehydrogenase complex